MIKYIAVGIAFLIFLIWLNACIKCWIYQDKSLFKFNRTKIKHRTKNIIDHDRHLKIEGER